MQTPQKRVLASFDREGVYVFQAFSPEIVAYAVAQGTFGKGFGMDRMTWIKPSFGWMLHRSGYGTKQRQEAVARIHLRHEGFLSILEQAVSTRYDANLFASEGEWALALKKSEVRVQWDPDRDLSDGKLDHRAIQLGLSGNTVHRYVREWILGVEDVTALVHQIKDAVEQAKELPVVWEEKEYPISPELALRLGYDK